MLNRVILYVSRNFGKMLSTFIMLTVMLSLIGTLSYIYATVNNRVDDVSLIRHNYLVDYEAVYGNEGSESKEYKSYVDIYEKMLSLDGLEAYRVDSGMLGVFMLTDEKLSLGMSEVLDFQIADEKHIDFVSGNAEIIVGELKDGGVLVSDSYADENGVSIGDEVNVSTYAFMEMEFDIMNVEETEPEFSYSYPLIISGIYSSKQESNDIETNTMYMPYETYIELENDLFSKSAQADENFKNNIMMGPDFTRVLAQYDNKESMKELDSFVEEEYDFIYTVDSAKKAEDSKEPLEDFSKVILFITIGIIVVSFVGIYLNMFLKLDKRRSEFIALLGFGINSIKLSIQVFLEQLIFALLALPVALLFTNSISKTVIEIVKKYYIVVIDESAGQEEMYGSWLSYITVDSSEIVNFESANLMVVMLFGLAIIVLSLLILSIFEVSRRYRNVKKV